MRAISTKPSAAIGVSVLAAVLSIVCMSARSRAGEAGGVVVAPGASFAERLAAREIRRYLYLTTGQLRAIRVGKDVPAGGILVGRRDRSVVRAIAGAAKIAAPVESLEGQEFLLRSVSAGGGAAGPVTLVVGGDDAGVLYGAYRLAERMGVRFFLHGDTVPEGGRRPDLASLNERGRPLFALRGLNPWGSHPFGIDLWDTDDYKAHVHQMAKMRMNFLGMHCYPEGHPYAEPTVWIGLPGEFDERGRVQSGYPSSYYTAPFSTRWGGLVGGPTGGYHYGAAMLFDRDGWGGDVMRDCAPRPTSPEACRDLFHRTGEMFREAFGLARRLGVKTCLGTESPLTIPRLVQQRLKQQGKSPADPAVVRDVYEAMFRRIAAAHPLDYYWLWTPEGWTWRGNGAAQMQATVRDIKIAAAAMKAAGSPMKLATAGWVLGPRDDRAAFDKVLPPEIALSAISRHLGEDPVEAAFASVRRRGTWAIPWMEGDNGGLAVPQLWVGRTRQDAADARAYGCTALMGLMWRTRIPGPNIAALARAGWEQPWADAGPTTAPAAALAEGPIGGKLANYPNAAVAGTERDRIYQTCRYDMRGYVLRVPNGSYRVRLGFCEPHFRANGQRVCDVKLQGKTRVKALDIHARVGAFQALDLTFDGVQVTGGLLRIDFVYRVSLPCISAIVVEGKGVTRKINCGGEAFGDYTADLRSPAPVNRRMRKVPCKDFYLDWAAAQFGPGAAAEIADIFARIDSRLPRPLSRGCPAGIKPDRRLWSQVAPAYAFVDELAACAPKVVGEGHRARFAYWLGTMRYLRAGAKLDCAVAQLQAALAAVKRIKDPAARATAARMQGADAYRRVLDAYGEAFGHLLDTVSTKGGLATIMYWEHGFFPVALGRPGKQLAAYLGGALPDNLRAPTKYKGRPRLIVPTVRSLLLAGERLTLQALLLSADPARRIVVKWRPMGKGEFRTIEIPRAARSVYRVTLPAEATGADLEYYIEADVGGKEPLRFPATAPDPCQTVIVQPA